MFKVGQKVVFTEASTDYEAGTKGVVAEVDEYDMGLPYYVELVDEDGDLFSDWCRENGIEADGEVIK